MVDRHQGGIIQSFFRKMCRSCRSIEPIFDYKIEHLFANKLILLLQNQTGAR
jgi:hypothetical protein